MVFSKAELRSKILKQRQQLELMQLNQAAENIVAHRKSHAALSELFRHAKYILSYSACKGEVSPKRLLNSLQATIYLPKIVDFKQGLMAFFPASQPQRENSYGIVEPSGEGSAKTFSEFDIVLVPLVAFDANGNRVGMGAGFYDRAISGLESELKRPLIIGLAHAFQEVNAIKPDSWDQPLDVILTDEKIIDLGGWS